MPPAAARMVQRAADHDGRHAFVSGRRRRTCWIRRWICCARAATVTGRRCLPLACRAGVRTCGRAIARAAAAGAVGAATAALTAGDAALDDACAALYRPTTASFHSLLRQRVVGGDAWRWQRARRGGAGRRRAGAGRRQSARVAARRAAAVAGGTTCCTWQILGLCDSPS
jgi:hypothetical protein